MFVMINVYYFESQSTNLYLYMTILQANWSVFRKHFIKIVWFHSLSNETKFANSVRKQKNNAPWNLSHVTDIFLLETCNSRLMKKLYYWKN